MGSRALVTGADGFIGSHLVEMLNREGYSVRALSQYNSFNNWGWLEDISCQNDVEIISGDIRDPHYCKRITKDIDVVFHLAALIAIPYSYEAPDSYVDTNIKGTLNICQAALENNVSRVIHTSTSEVYGTARYVPIDEQHPLQPQSPYSASKIGADAMAMSFHSAFEMPLTVARPFNTYGPRQSARAVIPTIIWIIRMFCRRRVLTIWCSEFLRADEKIQNRLFRLYRSMDTVSVTNSSLVPRFSGKNVNIQSLSFGLSILKVIDSLRSDVVKLKQQLGLDPDKYTIVISTNASAGQQHLKIIEQIRRIDDCLAGNYQLVFPMTYGADEVRESVMAAVADLKTSTHIFGEVMSETHLAGLRLATDMLIQVQITDQMSGAMLETLYAGGYVITGAWLPYESLETMGIDWTRISAIEELQSVFCTVMQQGIIKASPCNVPIIAAHFSWPVLQDCWVKFLVGN